MGAITERVNLAVSNPTHFNVIREVGKMDRRRFTDQIQDFTGYVDNAGEGATRPGLAFINFTKMIYAPLGLNKAQREARLSGDDEGRDMFDATQLTYLQALERSAADVMEVGMKMRKSRVEIKQDVKDTVWALGAVYKSLKAMGAVK